VKKASLKNDLSTLEDFPFFFHYSLLMMVSYPAPEWDASTKSVKFDRDNRITYQNLNLLIRFFGPFNYNTLESVHQLSQPLP